MNQIPHQQQVELPAVQLPLSGLKAEFHIQKHRLKQNHCPLDAGMDLYPSEIDKVTEHGAARIIWVHTFVIAHVGAGARGVIYPRSSSIDKLNGGQVQHGIIDAGYVGELMIRVLTSLAGLVLVRSSIEECHRNNTAIAQLCIEPIFLIYPVPVPINGFQPGHGSKRGAGGFGSTDNLKG